MKVLTITNMWPCPEAPYYGIFVKEQVESLKKHHPEVDNEVLFINGKKSKLNYILSIFQINWRLSIKNYDVIHIHYALSAIFLLFNPFIKSPILLTLHGSDFNSLNKIVIKLVNRILIKTDHIICLNDTMVSKLCRFNKKMHLIPCGVDTDLFNCDNLQFQESDYKIVFPSSKLRKVKNYALFSKIIQELELKHKVNIEIIEIDNKTRLEVNKILNSADLICMTSITEGSPQIIKEAMCCNFPIVSSDVGDVKNLLSKVRNCFVIENYEVDGYVESISKILKLQKNI